MDKRGGQNFYGVYKRVNIFFLIFHASREEGFTFPAVVRWGLGFSTNRPGSKCPNPLLPPINDHLLGDKDDSLFIHHAYVS